MLELQAGFKCSLLICYLIIYLHKAICKDPTDSKVKFFSKDLVIEVANQQCVRSVIKSSKKAAKRHKKEQEAIATTTMDNRSDGPIRISDIGSNT
ncbi:unnamed protein product [Camellia sinensis]